MKLNIKAKIDQHGGNLENIKEELAKKTYMAIAKLAAMTYNKAVEFTNTRLKGRRLDYINALHLEEEAPGIFVVSLDESAHDIEKGQPPHPMLPWLAQGPKSKVGKDGHRYTIIPLRHSTTGAPETAKPPQKDYADALQALIKQRDFKTVKQGYSPKTGKYTTIERVTTKNTHPYLKGLTRVREYKTKDSKKPTSSAYFTFRTASEKQDPAKSWRHPGTRGAKIFPDLYKWADQQLDTIVREFFSK